MKLFAGLIAALGIVAGVLWWRGRADDGASSDAGGDAADASPATPAARVHYRARADGVDPRLQAFLEEWTRRGTFDLSVARNGGIRTDEALQRSLYAEGKSNAPTLADSPHGRGGAIDVAPYTSDPVTDADPRWDEIGAVAESLGLVWGGRFSRLTDKPHVEVPDWRDLPFPPLSSGVA